MSDVTKPVNQNIPPQLRSVNFHNEDAAEGDILMVRDSLGYEAKNTTIKCTVAPMRIRFNVYHTVFPPRTGVAASGDLMYTSHLANLTSGELITDTSNAFVDINAGETVAWESGPMVRDIQLVTVSGHFDVWCS
jgi:hypothetical protein